MAFDAAGIDLPFPTRHALPPDQAEETGGDRSRRREGWPSSPDGGDPRRRRIVVHRDGRPAANGPRARVPAEEETR